MNFMFEWQNILNGSQFFYCPTGKHGFTKATHALFIYAWYLILEEQDTYNQTNNKENLIDWFSFPDMAGTR